MARNDRQDSGSNNWIPVFTGMVLNVMKENIFPTLRFFAEFTLSIARGLQNDRGKEGDGKGGDNTSSIPRSIRYAQDDKRNKG